jgi:hypothetical protein
MIASRAQCTRKYEVDYEFRVTSDPDIATMAIAATLSLFKKNKMGGWNIERVNDDTTFSLVITCVDSTSPPGSVTGAQTTAKVAQIPFYRLKTLLSRPFVKSERVT